MDSTYYDLSNVFFKICIHEILEASIEYENHRTYIIIELGEVKIRVRKIRIIAKVIEKSDKGRWIDIKLNDGTGEIIMRIWKEPKKSFINNIMPNQYVSILGFIKAYREYIYITPLIVKEMSSNVNFEKWYAHIKKVREFLKAKILGRE